MIANFFKQSKPIVFVVLGFYLSLLYLLGIISFNALSLDWINLVLILSKYLGLMLSFIAFSWTLKHFEIQKQHNYGALIFVMLSSFLMPLIIKTNFVFGLLILSFGLIRLINVIKSPQPVLNIFEATFFIVLSSLIYQPFIYFLLLVLSGTVIFLSPQWRFFTAPILAISAVVVFVEMYHLIWYNEVVYLDFFISKWTNYFDFSFDYITVLMISIWCLAVLISVIQIINVKQKRALFHNEMATFFLTFIGLSIIAYGLTNASSAELWLLSLWPVSIYLGDYLSNIKSHLWREVFFWSFVSISIVYAIIFSF